MRKAPHMNVLSRSFCRIILVMLCITGMMQAAMTQVNIPTNANTVPAATSGNTPNKPGAYASSAIINFLRTWTPKQPYTAVTDVTSSSRTVSQVDITTEYSDGFGRSIESVKWQASPNGTDLVTPKAYDAYGREADKYLTYAAQANTGSFKQDPFGDQSSFFASGYLGDQPALRNEQFYYTHAQLEASPLNRALANYNAGNSWVGSNRGVQTQYLLNTTGDAVQLWNITSSGLSYVNNDVSTNIPATGATYQAGTLTKRVTIDESGNQSIEFKDMDGLVVCKKIQAGAVTSGDPYTNWLCTYFVYDDRGQRRFVISPKAVAAMVKAGNWSLSTDMINELCFRYEFDDRGRAIAKKAPGTGWVYTVFDQMDRPVFTQDGNMRVNNQWLASLYDNQDRIVETAVITYASGPVALQTYVSANTGMNTISGQGVTGSYTGTAMTSDLSVASRVTGLSQYLATNSITFLPGFSSEDGAFFVAEIVQGGNTSTPTSVTQVNDNPVPAGSSLIALVLNYFDNYSNTTKTYNASNNSKLDQGGNAYADPLPSAASVMTAGLATSSKVRVIENANDLTQGSWLEKTNFYDDKGRTVQVQADNYKGGVDYTTSRYDFSGKAICTYKVHNNPAASVSNLTVKVNTDFDAEGRQVMVRQTINDDNAKTRMLEYDQYDALGKLSVRKLGQKSDINGGPVAITDPAGDNSDWLEIDKELYTINGWLKGINWGYGSTPTSSQVNLQNNKWFGLDLSYDWGFTTNQYNGNMGGQRWVSAGDGKERAYGYGYDAAQRLLKADFTQNFGSGSSPVWATADPNSSFTIDFSVKMGDGQNVSSAYDANGNILQMQQMGLVLNTRQQIDNLIYTYENGQTSNKVRGITDQSGSTANLGDFTDNNTSADDYGYDPNGNVITDLNKRMGGNTGVDQTTGGAVIYSYQNMPWQVKVKNPDGSQRGTITFIYDAQGNRLEKRTNELASAYNNNTATSTVTSYLGSFVYTNNALQYFLHAAGKARPTSNTNQPYALDYFLKDHLNNTRMILTDERQQVVYPVATVELTPASSLTTEQANYTINTGDITQMSPVTGYSGASGVGYLNNNGNPPYNTNPNSNTSAVSAYMYKLNGQSGDKTGLGITVKVMAGDQVNIWGKSFYHVNGTINNGYPVSAVLNTLIAAFAQTPAMVAGPHGATSGGLQASPVTPGDLSGYFTNNKPVPPIGVPNAYINWILFDEQFRPVSTGTNSGFLPVSAPDVIQSLVGTATITTSGYLYVYCSNESNNDVYFDNLQVVQNRGPLLEENHYYPFGLTMAGLNSRVVKTNYTENKRRFVAQELDDDMGLNWYQFKYRNHDPQTGRFTGIDPVADKYPGNSTYAYAENRPVNGIDQEGKEFEWVSQMILDWFVDAKAEGDQFTRDVHSYTSASANNYGHFDNSRSISDQVQENAYRAEASKLEIENHILNAGTKATNAFLLPYEIAMPELGALHMVVNGAQEHNYTKVGLGLLTFGVSGAFRYLIEDFEAAAAQSAMQKQNALLNFSQGVKSVIEDAGVSTDGVSLYGSGYSNKFIVLGRNMDERVIPAVNALKSAGVDAEYWSGFVWGASEETNLAANRAWLQSKLNEGYNVIDVGLDPKYSLNGNVDPGLFYGMESQTLQNAIWNYSITMPH